MNTKAPYWIEYIAHHTAPKHALTVLPKAAHPVRKCAIRLPDKFVFRDGILIDIRVQWTGNVYELVRRDDEWYLLRDIFGRVIGRRRCDVLFADEIADYKVAVLTAA